MWYHNILAIVKNITKYHEIVQFEKYNLYKIKSRIYIYLFKLDIHITVY